MGEQEIKEHDDTETRWFGRFEGYRAKQPTYGPVIIEKPIRSIGRFAGSLSPEVLREAAIWSKNKTTRGLPRPTVEGVYRYYQGVARSGVSGD